MSKTINISILLLLVTMVSYQCSPKTTAPAMKEKEVMEMASEDFRKIAPKPAAAPKINIGEAESFDLANGLKVIVVKNNKLPQVSYQVSLINDQISEGNKVGYIRMAGDILSRGTTTKTKAEIDEAVDFIGASMNTSSGGMFGSSLKKHSDKLLEVMSDVLFNPSFPDSELEKIKTQAISNIESNKTDPGAMMGNMKAVVNYGITHPYGEIQTADDVNNIKINDLKQYYETYFVPNNAYLIIVGDTDLAKAKVVANKYFGSWKKKALPMNKLAKVELPQSRQVRFANKEGAVQSVINVSYPVNLKPGQPDVIPSSVMNTILGGGFSSRLTQNLREDKAFTYGSGSRISTDPLIGNFMASASVRNEVTDSSITEILFELERIRSTPVDAEELQSRKNYMTGGFARSLESPQTIARFAYNRFRYNLPADYYSTYLEKLNAVTAADVQRMAQKYIKPDQANILVVGNKDEVADKLSVFDSDGEITYYNSFGEEVNYDSAALPDGVTSESIITDYLDALGGAAKINGVNTLRMKMSADLMGQTADIESYQKDGDKFAMSFGMGGMVMQQQVFDGAKVKTSAQGQNQIITEGPMFDEIKSGAKIIAQKDYLTDGTELAVKGIEDVDGIKAYKLSVKSSEGKISTEFYAVESGLMIRSITSPQEGQTVTTDFIDYKEVSGILFPHVTKVAGLMPMTLEMKVLEIEVNGSVPAGTFTIE